MFNTTSTNMKKVALIEFYPYHFELIHSQLLFLKADNYSPLFICDKQNSANLEILKKIAPIITYDFERIGSLFKLWQFLLKSHINYVVFNTAQGNRMVKFSLLPFPKKVKFLGILHNTNKLNTSFGQKIINRKIKSYYVLASYMQKFFPKKKSVKSVHINCAYPPKFKNSTIQKPKNEIWLGIPGSIEYKRRDYDFLLKLAADKLLPNNVKIVLLGNASKYEGPVLLKRIEELGIEQRFILFNHYVPDELFHYYMEALDFLLPLIHPMTLSASAYLKHKVSGTFIQSYIYSKPMLCHNMFNNEHFEYTAHFYNTTIELIEYLKLNREAINVYAPVFEQDKAAYCNFLIDA